MGLRMELHYLASAGMSAAKAVKSWSDDHDGKTMMMEMGMKMMMINMMLLMALPW